MRRDQSEKMSGKMTSSEIEQIEADNDLTDKEWWAKYGSS